MLLRSDEQFITNYLAGDEKSLELLIERYLKPIYSFTYRYVGNSQEAEDITQEVFVRVWKNLKKFDKKKSFKTWIFSIAQNASIDFLRKKKAIPFSEFENEKGENLLTNTLADLNPFNPKLSLVPVLERMPPKYRMVLFLRYNDRSTFREIAETLQESINTVKTRHRRGIAILRELLGGK